jgi:hypothetical protein
MIATDDLRLSLNEGLQEKQEEATMAATPAAEKVKHHDIVVNGKPRTVTGDELSFENILELAFNPVPSGPNWVFTVTYRRGGGHKPEGTLLPGQRVVIKNGMIFSVTATDKS